MAVTLLEDGRVAAAQRSDALGGFFVESSPEGAWEQIGLPFTQGSSIEYARRVSETWLFNSTGMDGCQPSESWAEAPPNTLAGAFAELVAHGAPKPLAVGEPDLYGAAVSPDGRCAHYDTVVYDLVTLGETPLVAQAVTWFP
jgi:hypothetical protein